MEYADRCERGKNESHRPCPAYDLRVKEAVAMENDAAEMFSEAAEAFRFACQQIHREAARTAQGQNGNTVQT